MLGKLQRRLLCYNPAVCIDSTGIGAVYGEWPEYDDFAFFVQTNCEEGNVPEMMQAGLPFVWAFNGEAAKVYKVGGTTTGENYLDLNDWQTGNGGEWLHWSAVNGTFVSEVGSPASCDDIGIDDLVNTNSDRTLIKSIDLLGRTVTENYTGLVIDVYDDGTTQKRVQVK